MNNKITPEKESHAIIERDLLRAMDLLKEKGIERTDKTLLDEFVEVLQNTLTKHLRDIREICDVVENRQNELLFWLQETKKMIDALCVYKEKIDEDALKKFSSYVDKVEREVVSRFNTMLKPSNN